MKRALLLFAVVTVGLGVIGGAAAWAQEKPAPPAAQDKAAADPVSGEWEGTVDMPDGAMPFSLKLKLEKDKVTGEVGGGQGTMAITEGSFADGKLAFSFNYVDGNAVAFSGTVAEGQITGSFSYGGGQMVLNCAAKKKVAK